MKWYRRLFGVVAAALIVGVVASVPTLEARQEPSSSKAESVGSSKSEGLFLKVPAEVRVAAGKQFLLKLETNAKKVRFWSPDGLAEWTFVRDLFPGQVRAENVIPFEAPAKDGTYRIFSYASNATDLTDGADQFVTRVVVGKGGPNPVDPVDPPKPPDPVDPVDPPQPPGPVGKAARFVVVEDTSKAGAWRGQMMGSPKVQAFYKANNLKHRIISVKAEDGEGQQVGEVAAFLKLAEGKETPWLFTQGPDGRILKSEKAATDEDRFIVQLGGNTERKAMGNLEPPRKRGKFKMFGEHPNVPMIPEDQWKPVNLQAFLPPVYDQDGQGACNAFSSTTAIEACYIQAGLGYKHLSRGYVYGNINGGRDQGSYLEDALEWLTDHGTCEASLIGDLEWQKGRRRGAAVDANAKQYRIIEAYECPSFEAMASALQQGFFINEGLAWPSNDNVDRDGWLPMKRSGNVGGHALTGYGLVQHPNGTWGIRTRNSWGTGWGIGGDCIIPRSYFTRSVGGYWAVRAVTTTPTDWPLPKQSLNLPNMFHKDLALAW